MAFSYFQGYMILRIVPRRHHQVRLIPRNIVQHKLLEIINETIREI